MTRVPPESCPACGGPAKYNPVRRSRYCWSCNWWLSGDPRGRPLRPDMERIYGEAMKVIEELRRRTRHLDDRGSPACGEDPRGAVVVEVVENVTCPDCLRAVLGEPN